MKIAYFDCSAGVSGDMILSSLVDAGLSPKYLYNELKKLSVGNFKLSFSDVEKSGIHAKYARITGGEQLKEFSKVKNIISKSNLPKKIKQKGLEIYSKIAAAESKVHAVNIKKVHFHEISELDTIIDVFGAVIGLDALKIQKVYSSPLNLGRPAPATVEIVKGLKIYSTDDKNELTTPTGAAIISAISGKIGPIPEMVIEKTGFGAGTADFCPKDSFGEKPNVLKLYIGSNKQNYFSKDEKIILETNIDDMDARIYPYVMEKLLKNGAVDVWLSNIHSKKGRPGIILTVLTDAKREKKLADIIFYETTTLGIRRFPVSRRILTRKKEKINKIAKLDNRQQKKSVEFEKAVKIAAAKKIPLRELL